MARTEPLSHAVSAAGASHLICFSHLRWGFVWQRPQHLMSRFARAMRVLFVEEHAPCADGPERLDRYICAESGVEVFTPRLAPGLAHEDALAATRRLVDGLIGAEAIARPVVWHYSPMLAPLSEGIEAAAVVYDCMDELANFRFAPPGLPAWEERLFQRADCVFTGGASLHAAKKDKAAAVHLFPSSVDRAHFATARQLPLSGQADDQAGLGYPRLGYCGVIDERLDLPLVAALADAHPEWSIVMVGPVVKIAESDLPRRPNIHYLGQKPYAALPAYLAGWDVALMPFALNDATRFISPTKTPEYLAAGRQVVSTPVADVVATYGDLAAVHIAGGAAAFVAACEMAIDANALPSTWLPAADARLSAMSWDRTHAAMAALIARAARRRAPADTVPAAASVPAPAVNRRQRQFDYCIVGAGFAGSVLAERLAAGSGKSVLLIDRRPHIGGNAFDVQDAAGILIHQYGPHIFHTNSDYVAEYLSRFTAWRDYEHRVLASVRGKLVPMPINRTTLNRLYGLDLATDAEAAAFLAARAVNVPEIRTSEDAVVASVGRDLYEAFFQGYTRKQWGMDPSALDKSVAARVPARTSTDDRYFTDSFQKMPRHGYTRLFENMLDQKGITRALGTDWRDVAGDVRYGHLIFTGPVDEYFGYRFGKLPYRSLRFEHKTLGQRWLQDVAVVNYPDEAIPYTRVTEYKHLTGQRHAKTSVTYEYPSAEGDPFYPVPKPENQALYKRYEALAEATPGVTFVGRLATYRYYNMDQVVAQALAVYRRLEGRDTLASPRAAASRMAPQGASGAGAGAAGAGAAGG